MNPCFDKTVDVDSLKPGQVNRIKNVRLDLGGKGINVAVVAERLGLEVQCIGIMGKEGGVELSDMMDREHLRHTFMEIPGHVRTNTKIFSRDGQGVTELNEPGTTVTPEQLQEFITLMRDETRGSDMVVLTGSLPPGCPEGTYCELMKALDGKRVILDTEGKELELAAKGAHPFLIKPNLREMEATLGIELRTIRTIRDAALLFIRLGVEHAVVSMGEMGAMYVSADKTLFAPALRVETKSTVGAGDAMIGGMLLGYEKEKDMARAFRYGIAAGAASVMTEGTQLIVLSDFERLLEQVKIQEV
ncbi:MAG: 1-phosphofructokinase family hexose kinase [Clostridia bacterium]|nr:1-phosphofructokinase family hexose kinase [Clostridia bacterium]